MRHFFDRTINDEEFLALEDEKESLFREIYQSKVQAIDGFMYFLDQLRTNGFKTAIATSAPQANLDLIVDTLGIRNQMDSILSSEDVTKHKPDPQVYLKSADNLQLAPQNCLVFEDSASGVTAGQNAGMEVVAVLSTHTKDQLPPCNFYINDYNDIRMEDIHKLLQI
jgi:HAD superfamily hydrolase (TIGR01509 family)